jgi:hypothetical protein
VLRVEASAQVFLGVRLQCAQCHNHPYDRWSQDDYHDWAAIFAPVGYKIIENKPTGKNDKNEFVGEQIVVINANTSRDHWPQCYTVLLAGVGVKGGFVHGASDARGEYPVGKTGAPRRYCRDDLPSPRHPRAQRDSRREQPPASSDPRQSH